MDEEERYVSLAEVRNLLEAEANRTALSYDKRLALEHAKSFTYLEAEDAAQLVAELMKMEKIYAPRAYKIAEILPKDADEVRAIFAKDRFHLTDEEIRQILEIVASYSDRVIEPPNVLVRRTHPPDDKEKDLPPE